MRHLIFPVIGALLFIVFVPCASAAKPDFVEGEVLVIFKPGCKKADAEAALGRRALKLDRQYRKIFGRSARMGGLVKSKHLGTTALIARLKGDPEVETVEPNYLRRFSTVTPNDTGFTKLWGLRNTGQTVNFTSGTSGVDANFLPAWKMSRPPATEVLVGVMDSGMDIGHPDLAANLWTNPGEIPGNSIDDDNNGYVDDVHGYSFADASADVSDAADHGTHVAGTIGAVGRNNTGMIGVEHHAKLIPLKVSVDGESISTSAVLDAISYSIALKQQGGNIVALNASFGGGSGSTTEEMAIEALRDAGIVLCVAAGNETTNNDITPSYPANYPVSNIISVAALTQTNTLASFSNYGATTVHLAAPGENIYSTLPRNLIPSQSGVTADAISYDSLQLQHSGTTTSSGISGTIHHCGIGNPGDFPAGVSGNIALIQRGTLTFNTKIANAMNAGATAAIIYDNTSNPPGSGWTLGSPGTWIPALQVTQASGQAILAGLPSSGSVVNERDDTLAYQFLDGTSMACPHVAGAVALAAINFPAETIAERINRILNNVTPVPALAGEMTTGGRLNLLKMLDTDSDTLPDWWEMENFTNLADNAATDNDADGFSNLDEFLTATHPKNAASHLSFSQLTTVVDGPSTHFDLSFPSVLDRRYKIEWNNTLSSGTWQPLGTTVIGTGTTLQLRDTDAIHSAGRRFYRMSVLHD